MIGFGEAVRRFYSNYFNFYGRATRAEYWWPVLMQLIVYTILVVAFILSAGNGIYNDAEDMSAGSLIVMLIGGLFLIINIIPGYSVAARRFHDLNQTGWLVLVFVIANAIIGLTAIAQFIWFAMPGTNGSNKYGPDPYGNEADVFG